MNQFISFLLLFFSGSISVAQKNYCIENRFAGKDCFKSGEIKSTTDVVYGYARNWKGETDTMKMDFFYPDSTKDKLSKKPFIMFMFPGGYSVGNRKKMHNMCILFAQKGYVTASIDYRVGWNTGVSGDCIGNIELFKDAVYKATQDARAALRFTVAHAAEYGIDTAWIFLGGASAGGANALITAFCTQQELNEKLEKQEMKFGAVDKSTNDLKTKYTIKGVINMWGGLFSDMHITPEDNIPTVMFHGEKDEIVPFNVSRFNNCYFPVAYPIVHGSKSLARKFREYGFCYELNTDPVANHGCFNDKYICEKASCFLKSIMCGTCSSSEQNTIKKPICAQEY